MMKVGHSFPPLFFNIQVYGIHFYISPDKLLLITDLYPSSIEQALGKLQDIAERRDRSWFGQASISARDLELHPWLKQGLKNEEYIEYILTHHDQ